MSSTPTAAPEGDRAEGRRDLPLVVDLDGTLIANDLLVETASRFLTHQPWRAWRLVAWLREGKAHAKRELWQVAHVEAASLAYHPGLVGWLEQERARGRTLVLASASDQGAVDAVAAHLGLFDVALGSEPGHNLRSEAKAEALTERFGSGGYEYVGNSNHDLAVWRHASTAHLASARASLRRRAGELTTLGQSFDRVGAGARPWVRAMRPHQWVKNLLVFVPLLTAQRIGDPSSVLAALLAFVAFCLAASSVYLLNDIADVEDDRVHATKRLRPFAAGTASLAAGWVVWPLLAAASLGLGALAGPLFLLVLVAYLVTTTAYSFALKRHPLVDILTLAGLYTVRLLAGAAAIGVALSVWLLTFSGFFFLSLALVKRVSELSRLKRAGAAVSGRGYSVEDLELLSSYGVATSVASVLVFTQFIYDPKTATLYETPTLLWATVPLLMWWIMRVWLKAHRGEMDEDPIVFAIRDRLSQAVGVVIVVVFAAATFLDLGTWIR